MDEGPSWCILESYEPHSSPAPVQDTNRYQGRGQHLNMQRAEQARNKVARIPGENETADCKTEGSCVYSTGLTIPSIHCARFGVLDACQSGEV